MARPLVSEPARESDPVSVLDRETCSTKVDDRPRVPARNSKRPLACEVARPSEPVSDLPTPLA